MSGTVNLGKSSGNGGHEPRVKPVTSGLLKEHVVELPTHTPFYIYGLVLLSALVREASCSWGGG